jgi:hypothetical protein
MGEARRDATLRRMDVHTKAGDSQVQVTSHDGVTANRVVIQ